MDNALQSKGFTDPRDLDAVRAQLERILASPMLAHSESLSRLLTYLVTRTLEGRGGCLKEYLIGVEAFNRGESFDPATDTIVRVQARRLRAKLTEYYHGPGGADALIIELLKGSYVPSFRSRQAPETGPRGSRLPRWLAASAAGLAAGAVILGSVLWRGSAPAGRSVKSVAILSLDNLSKDPAQDYLADGLTEELTTELSKTPGLRVIARTSMMQFKGGRKSVPEIARELNVDAVVEGSVLLSGDRVRVSAQLINAARNDHLWAETYDRSLNDVLAVHSELAGKIAAAVQSSLGRAITARTQPDPVDPQAHQLYLQGRYELNRLDERSLRASVETFGKAVRKDPTYAVAHAGLARSYLRLANFYDPPNEAMPKAREAAKKAIELDGDLADAHVALAYVHFYYDWDWDRAEAEAHRALALNPNSGEAHNLLGNLHSALGENEASKAEMKLAQKLDPLSVPLLADGMLALMAAGGYDEAAQIGASAAKREPASGALHSLIGLNHVLAGRNTEGLRELQAGVDLEASPMLAMLLSVGHATAGNPAEALRILNGVKETAKTSYVCAFEIGSVHAALGERDEAFRWIHKGLGDRCDCMVWLKTEPWIASIRKDPRYDELIRQVGFQRGSK